MRKIISKQLIFWIFLTCNLMFSFLIGIAISLTKLEIALYIEVGIFLFLIILDLVILKYLISTNFRQNLMAIIKIWSMLSINAAFAFVVGLSIPLMESENKSNFGYVMMPLLLLLNCIILDHFRVSFKSVDEDYKVEEEKKRPIIEFEGKKYIFSLRSIIIFAIGTPVLSYLIYLFFDLEINYWLHEIVVKQTVYFLNIFFNMGATTSYNSGGKYHWSFNIPGRGSIYFETFCTGIQAIAVFAGIIICTPHSQDRKTTKDIIWRKTKALIVSSIIFYVVNIFRMNIQLYLYYIGYAWDDIHVSISAASSFIAAIIILLLHKWIPEFIISIIYAGTIINEKMKKLKSIKVEKDKVVSINQN